MKLCMNLCLAAVFIWIIWTDIRTMTIPDNVLVPLVILAVMSVPAKKSRKFLLPPGSFGCFSVALPMYITDRFIDGAVRRRGYQTSGSYGILSRMEDVPGGDSYRILFRRTSGCDTADIRKSEIWRENKEFPLLRRSAWDCMLQNSGDQITGLFFGLTW